jgi:hypothetical protein
VQAAPFERLLVQAVRAGDVVAALVGLVPELLDAADALDPGVLM